MVFIRLGSAWQDFGEKKSLGISGAQCDVKTLEHQIHSKDAFFPLISDSLDERSGAE
jgi:hypothetical protein